MFARSILLTMLWLVACGDDQPEVERDPNSAQADDAGQPEDAAPIVVDARGLPIGDEDGAVIRRDAEVDSSRGTPNVLPYPACGGAASLRCPDAEFCSHETDGLGCGWADTIGTCRPRAETCSESAPVCACDGKTYESRCDAHAAGTGVKEPSPCKADRDTNCDERDAVCKKARPVCPGFKVASVVDQCWGPCVEIDACVCHAADECPERERFVCHMSAQHCGPYVN